VKPQKDVFPEKKPKDGRSMRRRMLNTQYGINIGEEDLNPDWMA